MTTSLYAIGETLPERFAELIADSLRDGHEFVQRLETEWVSGVNRFSKSGERLLAAAEKGRLIGIGGINIDPYLNDTAIGRIRHFYVHSGFRGNGVATAMLRDLERHAVHHFAVLTLRTNNPEADRFYRSRGFVTVNGNRFVTHEKAFRTGK
jgi:GNAT superfamily N-acetyltransferase